MNLTYHVLFWAAVYLLWIILFRSYSVALSKTMTIEFCYLIFITADYYLVNDFILPQLLHKKKYLLFVSSILILILTSSWLRALVALNMNRHFFHTPTPVEFYTLLFNSLLNISLWVLLITLGKMLIERVQTQRQMELLEKERVKTELDYLKAQINPHSLFNSLNTIYGHIDKNNQVARNILLQFSELLRYQLYDCAEDKVSLVREMEYVKNYTAFQRLRKEDRLVVQLQIEDIEPGLQIAPLLLVVLIENAFKFVSSFADRENKICIKIYTRGTFLYCTIMNTKENYQDAGRNHSKGIGILNLKRRLELLYDGKYEMKTNSDEGLYETYLKIDLA
jgi:two-component system LytT family sensor kinase